MKKGFTLLETLIAIAIMTVAVGAAFGMAQKSFQFTYQVKNQATAYFLAAEGLELVRNMRDNTALTNSALDPNAQTGWLSNFTSYLGKGFDIDPISEEISDCSGGSINGLCQLYQVFDSGSSIYTWKNDSGNSPASTFYRSINIACLPADCQPNDSGAEAVVTSTVVWPGNSVVLTETLTNWH